LKLVKYKRIATSSSTSSTSASSKTGEYPSGYGYGSYGLSKASIAKAEVIAVLEEDTKKPEFKYLDSAGNEITADLPDDYLQKVLAFFAKTLSTMKSTAFTDMVKNVSYNGVNLEVIKTILAAMLSDSRNHVHIIRVILFSLKNGYNLGRAKTISDTESFIQSCKALGIKSAETTDKEALTLSRIDAALPQLKLFVQSKALITAEQIKVPLQNSKGVVITDSLFNSGLGYYCLEAKEIQWYKDWLKVYQTPIRKGSSSVDLVSTMGRNLISVSAIQTDMLQQINIIRKNAGLEALLKATPAKELANAFNTIEE